MVDETEGIRRLAIGIINSRVESEDVQAERTRLEERYGQVWNTEEVSRDFEIEGFLAPCVGVIRKNDGKKGLLMFQHSPRFYFAFEPSKR
jgi:hypothetical protein